MFIFIYFSSLLFVSTRRRDQALASREVIYREGYPDSDDEAAGSRKRAGTSRPMFFDGGNLKKTEEQMDF